ncbi:hypothetical protein Pan258_01930 [Symmachiella dynata]|nr:hypothetical protein Pan258_01930 [Symmachiella dynata]
MSLYEDEPQANPQSIDRKLEEIREKTERVVTVLEENKEAIARWFWKGLLAFNLVLGSFVFWTLVVPHVIRLL